MSTSVETTIRTHLQANDVAQEPIEWAEIVARLDTETPFVAAPRRRSKVGFWVAVAAAVVTILLIGVIPLLISSQETQPADTIVPTTIGESTPTTLAESTPTTLSEFVLTAGTWSRVPHDEAVFGVEGVRWDSAMRSVTAGGPGLVAVGTDGSHYEHGHLLEYGDATVWTSVDGLTWSRVPHNEAVFGMATMNSVTAGGPGLVAVGDSDSGATVWTSPDGITWSRVPHDETVFGGAAMNSVTAGGPGLVAVGRSSDLAAVVWTSVDGLIWTRVPHEEAVFGGDEQVMNSVTAGGPGLVAVGWFHEDAGENADEDAYFRGTAVWTSVDGITWSRVPHDPAVLGGLADQWMTSVTVGGPGLVAVGHDQVGIFYGEANVPVWTSPDGITWSRIPYDKAVWGYGSPESVTAGGPGLVAVGADSAPWRADKGARVWTSPDGITWSRVPHEAFFGVFGEAAMTSVTAAGSGLVAVGVTWNTVDAVVWVTTTED